MESFPYWQICRNFWPLGLSSGTKIIVTTFSAPSRNEIFLVFNVMYTFGIVWNRNRPGSLPLVYISFNILHELPSCAIYNLFNIVFNVWQFPMQCLASWKLPGFQNILLLDNCQDSKNRQFICNENKYCSVRIVVRKPFINYTLSKVRTEYTWFQMRN